jgi:hypothetical protein
MGLDSVEIVMELEDEFGISIPDEDAEHLVTVGGIVDYLAKRVTGGVPAKVCRSHQVFGHMRRAMMQVYGVPRDRVRLDHSLHSLVNDAARLRAGWGDVMSAARLTLPRLQSPRDRSLDALQAVTLLPGATISVLLLIESPWWTAAGLVVTSVVWSLLDRCREPGGCIEPN